MPSSVSRIWGRTLRLRARRRRSNACGRCIAERFSWKRTRPRITCTTTLPATIRVIPATRTARAFRRRTSVRNSATAAAIARIVSPAVAARLSATRSSVLATWRCVSAIPIFARPAERISSSWPKSHARMFACSGDCVRNLFIYLYSTFDTQGELSQYWHSLGIFKNYLSS